MRLAAETAETSVGGPADSVPLPLLWACFPVELCHGQGEHAIALRRAHLASASFRQVPRLARGCSALLPGLASEHALLVLDGLHSELRARAWGEGLPDATAVRLQRSLFLCAVVLLHSLLEKTPTPTPHAEAALCTLAALALGAVAVDELEPLERLLLDQLQRTDRLPVLLELALPGAGPMTPALEARRWVVLRWVELAMQPPDAMAQLQPILPPLLAMATSLPRPQQPSAGLLRAALSQLAVEEEAQLQTAAGLLAQLGGDCGRLLEHEASLARPAARARRAAAAAPARAAPRTRGGGTLPTALRPGARRQGAAAAVAARQRRTGHPGRTDRVAARAVLRAALRGHQPELQLLPQTAARAVGAHAAAAPAGGRRLALRAEWEARNAAPRAARAFLEIELK